jgi:hypothetical protein
MLLIPIDMAANITREVGRSLRLRLLVLRLQVQVLVQLTVHHCCSTKWSLQYDRIIAESSRTIRFHILDVMHSVSISGSPVMSRWSQSLAHESRVYSYQNMYKNIE